jgi:DNA-directed RNA polymerase specialized sigma24 family protein
MDRIKELLREWASYHIDRRHGWPTQAAFATERVDGNNRSTDTYHEMPDEIVRLNTEIERLAPGFKRILRLEYLDNRPQKTKAALLGIPREVFSVRLRFIHEQLDHAVLGV